MLVLFHVDDHDQGPDTSSAKRQCQSLSAAVEVRVVAAIQRSPTELQHALGPMGNTFCYFTLVKLWENNICSGVLIWVHVCFVSLTT